MLTPRTRARAGATLAELLVALTLTAIVLGTGTSSLLRQRRTATAIGGQATSSAQLRAATGALRAELSALGQGTGDLVPGEARDTSLQLRMLVVAGIACGDAEGSATFADDDEGVSVLSASAPKAGDTLWWFGADPPGWRGRRITASDSVSAPCMLSGAAPRPARRVVITGRDTIPFGAILRVTRPARYAFYKSGDGSWQLGFRDWLEASGRFAPPQPIAGPFAMHAGEARTGFRYFGADGGELPSGPTGASAALVARVRLTVLAADPLADATGLGLRRDSVDVALQGTRGP